MNKHIIKWSGIAFLLALCIFCVYSYNTLFESTPVPPEDDEPVVSLPTPEPEPEPEIKVNYTDFPKPSIPSPFSNSGYMQNIGGSRDDTLSALWSIGGVTYVVGHTFSSDYDFNTPDPGVFVATLSQSGTLDKTLYLSQNSLYLASTVFSSGVVVSTTSSSGLVTHFLDGNLKVINTVRHDVLTSAGKLLLSGNDVYGLYLSQNTLFLTRTDTNFSTTLSRKLACDNVCEIVDFSILGNRIYILVNTKTDFYFITLDKELNEKSRARITATGSFIAQSAIPSAYKGVASYTLTAKHGDTITLLCVNEDGQTEWSKSLSKATKSKILRTTSANLLVFCATSNASTASVFCSHGDVIEENVLALTGYFPIDFTYTDSLVVLLSSVDKKKGGAIASINSDNLSSVVFSLPDVTPTCLALSGDSLLLGASADSSVSGFSTYGGQDCFVVSMG